VCPPCVEAHSGVEPLGSGSQKFSGVDGGNATRYFKYGIYLRPESHPKPRGGA